MSKDHLFNSTQGDTMNELLKSACDELHEIHKAIGKTTEDVVYTDADVYGVEVDYTNKTFTRLAAAAGKSAGSDFDKVHAFGGRRRCNLADDGTVNAYYGDAAYVEDGSNGQVMVEQPAFYYKVTPITLDAAAAGGFIVRKARYYVSDSYHPGFKLHPAFIVNGKTCDKVYLSAFEGCLYDASAGAYIKDDAQVADFNTDKLSSIAGAKPISGLTQNLTRANIRNLCHNRGDGWELQTIQCAAASQLLMLVEYGQFNMQSAIGQGAVNKADNGSTNMAENTGATSSLGNKSGAVANANNIQMVSYRGEENPWGNIWKWIDGLNMYKTAIYIADHGFKDDTDAAPYQDTGFHCASASGYVSAWAYSEDFDWLFIAAEVKGDSSVPIGDYFWVNATYGWLVAGLGAWWDCGLGAGPFGLNLHYASGYRDRYISGRPVYRKAAA